MFRICLRFLNLIKPEKCALICGAILFSAISQPAWAKTDPAHICDVAAQQVAKETGVPLKVLRAITRTETGRRRANALQPWPWTVNLAGKGIWFDTADQAQTFIFRHFKRGARSFDVGCFQINYKWHGHAFNSIEEMFDPVLNARYAARFLLQLHNEFGDWTRAAGAYHSRTQKYASRYVDRYAQIYAALPEAKTIPGAQAQDTRTNAFPLLQQRQTPGALGSLMPQDVSGRSSLFAQRDGG